MQDRSYVPFTEEMKREYTILVPNMLPMHFKLIISVLETYGYHMELLQNDGPQIAETGLKYTQNDACYPAILVIGQFMDALLSGKYDPHKVALIMFQTGGGCRASNYISLIRKALKRAGLEFVPVISFSLAGLEKHPGFQITLKMYHKLLYAVLYGDLLMSLVNQVRPYEKTIGQAEQTAERWTKALGKELGSAFAVSKKKVYANSRMLIADFEKIEMIKEKRTKVGIVGEIFVKYSPLANNHLEAFLIREGAETVVPGLLDFCLYVAYNHVAEYALDHSGWLKHALALPAYRFLLHKREEMNHLLQQSSVFEGFTPFDQVVAGVKSVISPAVKMGEGWLLPAEMLELSRSGCKNIVCAQPFGCLPNHICGKGMMKPIRELCPDVNIVAIDYDAGASRVNQENRLKLMLANAAG